MISFELEPNNIEIKTGNYILSIVNICHELPIINRYIDYHSHNSFEFHFVADGKGELYVNKKNYTIEKNNIFVIAPSVTHNQRSGNIEPIEEYSFNIFIKDLHSNKKTNLDLLIEKFFLNPFFVTYDNFKGCEKCIEIINEIVNPTVCTNEKVKADIISLLITISRLLPGVKQTETSFEFNPNLTRKLDLIMRSFNQPLKLEEVAKEMFISKRHLIRIIKKVYNMTFTEKIKSLRIEYSKALLTNSDLPIHKIAEKSGFSSPQIFSKTFKKEEGCSPNEYRKKFRI